MSIRLLLPGNARGLYQVQLGLWSFPTSKTPLLDLDLVYLAGAASRIDSGDRLPGARGNLGGRGNIAKD
jgi:hypothetical protein